MSVTVRDTVGDMATVAVNELLSVASIESENVTVWDVSAAVGVCVIFEIDADALVGIV